MVFGYYLLVPSSQMFFSPSLVTQILSLLVLMPQAFNHFGCYPASPHQDQLWKTQTCEEKLTYTYYSDNDYYLILFEW